MTFGQGHGFATGGLQYGAANAGLNANEERMRSLLRGGRDGASIGGSGDAKREFNNFPNYHSHSPFASTSASGSLGPTGPPSYASLSSFSGEEKQRKKKGKKHRHANTSSSSGVGALMDVSDHSAGHMMASRFNPGAGGGPGAAFGGGNSAYSGMHGGGYGGGRW